ncbi:DUF6498-containing protein [Halobaculum magnesiiphilum]|uniref:Uncharacterized protein n=1 Tax=Halobaculum magnesiiphilum TaxID=1017351 RepID=A0A8T8WAN9_9EURY|nr:DUF6498-containing protein [Halobaculum magnesiiphilum]QZP36881.1 hypothetical protein K6T50_11325 [Halobaculum magnesiiphilum]
MRSALPAPPALRSGPLAVLASNLVAPVGVLAFGWSTTVLLGVFVVDVIAGVWWAVPKVPFAAKRPNNAIDDDSRLFGPFQTKRGEITLPDPIPPVYLRNLPTLLVVACFLAPLETVVAFTVFALPDPTITDAVAEQLLLGGLAVVAGRGYETWADYFRGGGFRDHSPRSVLLVPFMHLFAVGGLVFVAGGLAGSGVAGDAVLGLVVAGKLAFDLRTLQIERDPDRRGWFYRFYGSAETEIDPEPVAVPDGDPVVTVRPARRVAVVDAAVRGLTYSLSSAVLVVWGIVILFVGLGAWSLAVWPALALVAFVGVRALGRYLAYGSVEYRAYDGVLVVYDRLLDEPQARIEGTAVTDASVARDPVDRVFDTRTLDIGGDDDAGPDVGLTVPDPEEVNDDDANANRSLSVAHVSDPDPIVEALGAAWHLER